MRFLLVLLLAFFSSYPAWADEQDEEMEVVIADYLIQSVDPKITDLQYSGYFEKPNQEETKLVAVNISVKIHDDLSGFESLQITLEGQTYSQDVSLLQNVPLIDLNTFRVSHTDLSFGDNSYNTDFWVQFRFGPRNERCEKIWYAENDYNYFDSRKLALIEIHDGVIAKVGRFVFDEDCDFVYDFENDGLSN